MAKAAQWMQRLLLGSTYREHIESVMSNATTGRATIAYSEVGAAAPAGRGGAAGTTSVDRTKAECQRFRRTSSKRLGLSRRIPSDG